MTEIDYERVGCWQLTRFFLCKMLRYRQCAIPLRCIVPGHPFDDAPQEMAATYVWLYGEYDVSSLYTPDITACDPSYSLCCVIDDSIAKAQYQ